MTQNFGNAFLKKPAHKHEPAAPEPAVRPALISKVPAAPKPTYAKIFRWQLPEDRMQEPATVEIVGTFTNWQKVPLIRKNKADGWR